MKLLVVVTVATACGQPSSTHSGMDAGTLPPDDSVTDTSVDGWYDAHVDASVDGALDAPPDAALPQLVTNTDAIDFGAVEVSVGASYALTIQNQGTSAAFVSVTIAGDRPIYSDSGGCYVMPMQTCTIPIRFLTYSVGEKTATVTLTSGAWQHVVTARGESATALHLTKWGGGGMTAPNLNCPIGCDTIFAKDIVVTAVPTSGNQFVTWSDPTCGTQPTCTVHQEAIGRYLKAYFAPISSTTLSIAVTGGSVRVENAQFGLNVIATCSGPCDVPIPLGVPIKVSANSLGEVVGISGACTGVRSCMFTSSGSTSIAVAIQRDPKGRRQHSR
jgi:hypothetical protein